MNTCYLFMFINVVNMLISGLSGHFHFSMLGVSHMRYSIVTIMVFLLTETMIMFFFIATGKAIREAIMNGLGEVELWDRERTLRRKLFPHLMVTLILVSTVFILGGAADNEMPSAWLHGPMFLLAFVHHIWTLVIKNSAFKEQIGILSELEPEPEKD